ncbi:hypothetical protein JP0154_09670 [Helicobacter pylori]
MLTTFLNPEREPLLETRQKNLIAKEYYLKAKIKNRVMLKKPK